MRTELEKILIEKYPDLLKDYGGDPMYTCMAWGLECGDGWFKIIDHLFSYFTKLMKTPIRISYTEDFKKRHKEEKDYYEKYYNYSYKPPQIVLAQVKEKWGTLTVYHDTIPTEEIPEDIWGVLDVDEFYKKLKRYNDKIEFAIDYAEYLSSITCEITGKDGKRYTKGWYQTLCDEEAVKRGHKLENAAHSNELEEIEE
jgi:hypothetical protein